MPVRLFVCLLAHMGMYEQTDVEKKKKRSRWTFDERRPVECGMKD